MISSFYLTFDALWTSILGVFLQKLHDYINGQYLVRVGGGFHQVVMFFLHIHFAFCWIS